MACSKNIIRRPDRWGWVALAVVYLVWGSTYLAIREAVRGDGALPPFLLGALRMGAASALLFAIARWRGERLRPGKRGLMLAGATGLLLWVGGNGLVIVGLTRLDSGLAAVLMSTTPMWVALLETVRSRRLPGGALIGGLLLGFAGVAVLIVGSGGADSGNDTSLLGIALVLLAAFSWALGTQVRSPRLSPLAGAAWIMLAASVGFAIISVALAEPIAMPSTRALIALAYLAVVGSGIGFVAYLVACQRLALPLVMTHAQVNPLVAVGLGAMLAGEAVTVYTGVAALLIIVSIPLSRDN